MKVVKTNVCPEHTKTVTKRLKPPTRMFDLHKMTSPRSNRPLVNASCYLTRLYKPNYTNILVWP